MEELIVLLLWILILFIIPTICIAGFVGIIYLITKNANNKIKSLENNKTVKEINKEISNINNMINNRNQQKN